MFDIKIKVLKVKLSNSNLLLRKSAIRFELLPYKEETSK